MKSRGRDYFSRGYPSLVLASLILQLAACGVDEDKTNLAKRDGYLVDGCQWQAFPSLPDVGEDCFLDVFLSANAPVGTAPEVCDEEPMMSLCWLDALGHAVDPTSFVVLDGREEPHRVCTISEKDPDAKPICEERRVFVPNAIHTIEGRTGATK